MRSRKPLHATPLPGDTLDVSRVEHENLAAEVVDNGRRLERLEAQIQHLASDLAALRKLMVHASV